MSRIFSAVHAITSHLDVTVTQRQSGGMGWHIFEHLDLYRKSIWRIMAYGLGR